MGRFDQVLRLFGKRATSTGPCGQVIRLDRKGFKRLDLFRRLAQLVDNAEFADEEFHLMSSDDLQAFAFKAYALAYVSWNKELPHTEWRR